MQMKLIHPFASHLIRDEEGEIESTSQNLRNHSVVQNSTRKHLGIAQTSMLQATPLHNLHFRSSQLSLLSVTVLVRGMKND